MIVLTAIKKFVLGWFVKKDLAKVCLVTTIYCIILSFLIFQCGCIYRDGYNNGNEKHDLNVIHGEDKIVMEDERVFSGISKTALDRDIPQNLETATLAMG